MDNIDNNCFKNNIEKRFIWCGKEILNKEISIIYGIVQK